MNAFWIDEWQLSQTGGHAVLLAVSAKRAKRRLSHREFGTEEYLVSDTDTSSLARRVDSSPVDL